MLIYKHGKRRFAHKNETSMKIQIATYQYALLGVTTITAAEHKAVNPKNHTVCFCDGSKLPERIQRELGIQPWKKYQFWTA